MSTRFLKWLLILSIGLNAWLFFSPKGDTGAVLASAAGQSFRRSNLSDAARKNLEQIGAWEYASLRQDIDRWLEATLLSKESLTRGKTAAELLQESAQPAPVAPAEVSERLSHAPAADRLSPEQAREEIAKDLAVGRAAEARDAFLKSLYSKYNVRIFLKAPAGVTEKFTAPSRYPAYEPLPGPSAGPADAPVTLEIWSDFLCPFSARFSRSATELRQQYPDKLRVVFHQFPLPMHDGAHLLSEASLCADEQGKFWEYHDRLMGEQKKRDKEELAKLAQELGLDAEKFRACVDGGKNAAKTDADIALGKAVGVTGTPGFKINGRLSSGAMPAGALKPMVDWCLDPKGSYPGLTKNAMPSAAPRRPGLDPAKAYAFPNEWLDKGPSRGPKNAPVTIVEFVDYHCPFCQRGTLAIDGVVANHAKDVRFISKNFPLPMHPNAMKAAVAASCAAEQGKFWEYRSELFGASWGKQSAEDLKAAAKRTGLDAGKFDACLDSDRTKPAVEEDVKTGAAVGVTGTPTYFINGMPTVGAASAESFEAAVKAQLEKKK